MQNFFLNLYFLLLSILNISILKNKTKINKLVVNENYYYISKNNKIFLVIFLVIYFLILVNLCFNFNLINNLWIIFINLNIFTILKVILFLLIFFFTKFNFPLIKQFLLKIRLYTFDSKIFRCFYILFLFFFGLLSFNFHNLESSYAMDNNGNNSTHKIVYDGGIFTVKNIGAFFVFVVAGSYLYSSLFGLNYMGLDKDDLLVKYLIANIVMIFEQNNDFPFHTSAQLKQKAILIIKWAFDNKDNLASSGIFLDLNQITINGIIVIIKNYHSVFFMNNK